MCFFIHPSHKEIKIAKKDITCYKFLKKDLSSPYREFQYEMGETYYEDSLWGAKNSKSKYKALYLLNVGLHSYTSLLNEMLVRIIRHYSYNFITVKCIIPEGAQYYYDPSHGVYISNYITIKEIV